MCVHLSVASYHLIAANTWVRHPGFGSHSRGRRSDDHIQGSGRWKGCKHVPVSVCPRCGTILARPNRAQDVSLKVDPTELRAYCAVGHSRRCVARQRRYPILDRACIEDVAGTTLCPRREPRCQCCLIFPIENRKARCDRHERARTAI